MSLFQRQSCQCQRPQSIPVRQSRKTCRTSEASACRAMESAGYVTDRASIAAAHRPRSGYPRLAAIPAILCAAALISATAAAAGCNRNATMLVRSSCARSRKRPLRPTSICSCVSLLALAASVIGSNGLASTPAHLIESRAVPPFCRASDQSACAKRLKMRDAKDGSMPGPQSQTLMR